MFYGSFLIHKGQQWKFFFFTSVEIASNYQKPEQLVGVNERMAAVTEQLAGFIKGLLVVSDS